MIETIIAIIKFIITCTIGPLAAIGKGVVIGLIDNPILITPLVAILLGWIIIKKVRRFS